MLNFQKHSIGTNLFSYGILLTVLPLILAGGFITRSVRQNYLEQAERELNIVTQAMALDLVKHIDELGHDAEMIADLPVIQSMDQPVQTEYLQQAYLHHDRYNQLAIIGLDGQIVHTATGQKLTTVNHIESFQKAAQGVQSWVVAPALFDDQLVLHMHTPIWNDGLRESQVGVLGSPIPFNKIAGILDKYDHNMPNSVFVLGADNRVLIHLNQQVRESRPDYSMLFRSESLAVSPISRIEGVDSTTYNTSFVQGDDTFLASLTKINGSDWTVVAQKKHAVILAPLRTIQLVVALIISVLMILNVSLLVFVKRRITQPIVSLAKAAVELEANNSEAALPTSEFHCKEIKKLIFAFSNMRQAVQDREHKLQNWSKTLEKKVKIRTAELSALNQYLELEIQDHKQTARELERSRDEAEWANQVKDTFLARMSHELRTPLNAIIGYSELIRETASEASDEFLAGDAETISTAARHLSDIINNLLSYSEIQSDNLQISKNYFFLDEMVDSVRQTVQPLANANENRLIITNHTDNEQIYSDEYKIQQILQHLLSNAAKFTQQGTISLDIMLKYPGDWDAPAGSKYPWLYLHINDTGVGIVEDSIDSIFYPFLQVESSYNRPQEGAGLGLVLTQNFVDVLDGSIKVNSEVGFGTNFEVMIPLSPA
ncbi:MAG: ATP-binding protein [Chloroflexota bacterium]